MMNHPDESSSDDADINTSTAVGDDTLPQSEGIGDEEPKEKLTRLPMGRVRLIMKKDPSVNMVTQEALFLITKSTELFIDNLTKESYRNTQRAKKKSVQKRDIESAVDSIDALAFLEGTLE